MKLEKDWAIQIEHIESGRIHSISEIDVNAHGDMGLFENDKAIILFSPIHAARLGYALLKAAEEYKALIDAEKE